MVLGFNLDGVHIFQGRDIWIINFRQKEQRYEENRQRHTIEPGG